MNDSNDILESADVVGKRPCKNGTLTEEQRIQIKIEILVAGGYEEIADRAVRNISDIIEGKVNRKIKRRGAPRLTSEQLDDTISKIRIQKYGRNGELGKIRDLSVTFPT